MSIIQKAKNGEILYCIMFARRIGPGPLDWKQEDLYLHAKDAGDANLKFFYSEDERTRGNCYVVGIAPVVGFHVDDNHGEKLSV